MGTTRQKLAQGLYGFLFPSTLLMKPLKRYEYREVTGEAVFSRDDVILDLGCGAGLQAFCLARKTGKVIGIDTDPAAIQKAQRDLPHVGDGPGVEFRCTSLRDAGFAEESFDVILSLCVLEHVPDVDGLLAECHRKLKKGALLLLSADSLGTVRDDALREQHRCEHGVVRYFRGKELCEMLEAAGFRDVSVRPILRSSYATRLFREGVRTNFSFGFGRSMLAYPLLVLCEWVSREREAGLFLVATAKK